MANKDKVESFLRSLQDGLAYVAWDKIRVQDQDSKRPENAMPVICFPVVCICENVLEDTRDLQPLNENDKDALDQYLFSVGFTKTSVDEMEHMPTRLFRFYELDLDYRNPAILLDKYKDFCIKNNIPTFM